MVNLTNKPWFRICALVIAVSIAWGQVVFADPGATNLLRPMSIQEREPEYGTTLMGKGVYIDNAWLAGVISRARISDIAATGRYVEGVLTAVSAYDDCCKAWHDKVVIPLGIHISASRGHLKALTRSRDAGEATQAEVDAARQRLNELKKTHDMVATFERTVDLIIYSLRKASRISEFEPSDEDRPVLLGSQSQNVLAVKTPDGVYLIAGLAESIDSEPSVDPLKRALKLCALIGHAVLRDTLIEAGIHPANAQTMSEDFERVLLADARAPVQVVSPLDVSIARFCRQARKAAGVEPGGQAAVILSRSETPDIAVAVAYLRTVYEDIFTYNYRLPTLAECVSAISGRAGFRVSGASVQAAAEQIRKLSNNNLLFSFRPDSDLGAALFDDRLTEAVMDLVFRTYGQNAFLRPNGIDVVGFARVCPEPFCNMALTMLGRLNGQLRVRGLPVIEIDMRRVYAVDPIIVRPERSLTPAVSVEYIKIVAAYHSILLYKARGHRRELRPTLREVAQVARMRISRVRVLLASINREMTRGTKLTTSEIYSPGRLTIDPGQVRVTQLPRMRVDITVSPKKPRLPRSWMAKPLPLYREGWDRPIPLSSVAQVATQFFFEEYGKYDTFERLNQALEADLRQRLPTFMGGGHGHPTRGAAILGTQHIDHSTFAVLKAYDAILKAAPHETVTIEQLVAATGLPAEMVGRIAASLKEARLCTLIISTDMQKTINRIVENEYFDICMLDLRLLPLWKDFVLSLSAKAQQAIPDMPSETIEAAIRARLALEQVRESDFIQPETIRQQIGYFLGVIEQPGRQIDTSLGTIRNCDTVYRALDSWNKIWHPLAKRVNPSDIENDALKQAIARDPTLHPKNIDIAVAWAYLRITNIGRPTRASVRERVGDLWHDGLNLAETAVRLSSYGFYISLPEEDTGTVIAGEESEEVGGGAVYPDLLKPLGLDINVFIQRDRPPTNRDLKRAWEKTRGEGKGTDKRKDDPYQIAVNFLILDRTGLRVVSPVSDDGPDLTRQEYMNWLEARIHRLHVQQQQRKAPRKPARHAENGI